MGQNTSIEWTDVSSNPIRVMVDGERKGWFCTKVSAGCANCYSERRNNWLGNRLKYKKQNEDKVTFILDEKELSSWYRINEPRRIFVCDMTDLFHPLIPDAFISAVWWAMEENPRHTFQVLTKRPERMASLLGTWADKGIIEMPLPNVWLGVSAEDQKAADERIPLLLRTPAVMRFVSVEPLLGPVSLTDIQVEPGVSCNSLKVDSEFLGIHRQHLNWVIAGGESGPHARPCHPDWLRQLRNECQGAGVAFFLKQRGEFLTLPEVDAAGVKISITEALNANSVGLGNGFIRVGKKAAGRLLDGLEWSEFPDAR